MVEAAVNWEDPAEHAEIIRLHIEEELGINKIAEMLGRSSRTTLNAYSEA